MKCPECYAEEGQEHHSDCYIGWQNRQDEEKRMNNTKDALYGLAQRLEARAIDINCAHAHQKEDKAVRRAMIVIYHELAEMMREEASKNDNRHYHHRGN